MYGKTAVHVYGISPPEDLRCSFQLLAAKHWGVEDLRSALGLLMLGRMLYSVPLPGSKSSKIGYGLTLLVRERTTTASTSMRPWRRT